ncbi:hypothetical protein [Providencia alcalifaciens]|uniref:hypothetical protein n=1 Tax=Providencia alcalifaciens TaxID=126385 RepID=UPI000D3D29F3|nr:hypothetical protein [Providencia alcalifaciens]MBG5881701.1 hypothetical protein [Providencia alcalifaciens]
MWLNITSGDFDVNTAGDNNIIGGDTLLNLNDIYFQKLFILRGKSHWRGIAGTKKPSRGGLGEVDTIMKILNL